MISKEKRQILRKQATERMSKKRVRDQRLGLPSKREADKAIRDGVVRLIDKSFIRKRSDLTRHRAAAAKIMAHPQASGAAYDWIIAEIIELAFVGLRPAENEKAPREEGRQRARLAPARALLLTRARSLPLVHPRKFELLTPDS